MTACGNRRCCPACRRDADLMRRNPARISEYIDVIGEVLHGHSPRVIRSVERTRGRYVPREMRYLSCYGVSGL